MTTSRKAWIRRQLPTFILGALLGGVACAGAWLWLPLSDARLAAELRERPDFLADHPDLLGAARLVVNRRILQSQGLARQQVLQRKWGRLLATDLLPTLGSRSAPIVMIEFTDYSCAPCKKIAPIVARQTSSPSDVRTIIMVLPTGGPIAELAARAAFAAYRQDPEKFRAFHAALMDGPQLLTQAQVLAAATSSGLDAEQLMREIGYSDSRNYVRQVSELAADLGITGVPAIVIGEQLLLGTTTTDALGRAISEVRRRDAI